MVIVITDFSKMEHKVFMDKTGAAGYLGMGVKKLDGILEREAAFLHYLITQEEIVKSKRGKK